MTARLKGPENHGGFSHDGVSYEPDADGIIEVPHEAVTAAFSHGFTLVPGQIGGADAGDNGTADTNKTAKPLNKMSKAELVAHALTEHKLELVPDNMTAKEMIAAIDKAAAEQPAA